MAYATYEYYQDSYLKGREPKVSEQDFPYWEDQAEARIDEQTFGRLKGKEEVPEEVKKCACELTEFLFRVDTVFEQSLQYGGAGPLSSFSNDGQSATFEVGQSAYTESGSEKKVREIIFRYLGNTGLLYGGGVCLEP